MEAFDKPHRLASCRNEPVTLSLNVCALTRSGYHKQVSNADNYMIKEQPRLWLTKVKRSDGCVREFERLAFYLH
jgi:hypothetical protein